MDGSGTPMAAKQSVGRSATSLQERLAQARAVSEAQQAARGGGRVSGVGVSKSPPKKTMWSSQERGFSVKMHDTSNSHTKHAWENSQDDSECTFKPKLVARYKARSKHVDQPLSGRLCQWEKDQVDKERRRIQLKQELEAEEMKECTFHPNVQKRNGEKKATEAHQRTREHGKIADLESLEEAVNKPFKKDIRRLRIHETAERLHNDASRRAIDRQLSGKRAEEKQIREYAFKPKINEKSRVVAASKTGGKPLTERLSEIQKEKRSRLHKLRVQREQEDPNLTFQPKINATSNELALNARTGVVKHLDVVERLSTNVSSALTKKIRRQEQLLQEQALDHTFVPEVSENSRKIIEHSKFFRLTKDDFVARQEMLSELKRIHTQVTAHELNTRDGCSFKPDIGNATEILANSKHRHIYANESQQEKLERLAYRDVEERQKNRERLENKHYSEIPFKPKVSEESRKIVERNNELKKSILERESTLGEQTERQQKAKQKADAEFRDQHPFKPSLIKPADTKMEGVQPYYKVCWLSYFFCRRIYRKDTLWHAQGKILKWTDLLVIADQDCVYLWMVIHFLPHTRWMHQVTLR